MLKIKKANILMHLPNLRISFILWVEADLIEAIHPIANIMRPARPSILQADTRNIFEQFRTSIHLAHGSRHAVKLADGPII